MVKFFLFAFFFILMVCTQKKDLEVSQKQPLEGEYFPVSKGNFLLYEVKQSTFPAGIRLDSVYKLKEIYADTFTDQQGGISYRIMRFRTKPPVDTFSLDSIWHVKVSGIGVVKTENNVPFLKLPHPLELNKTWNGNQYNTNEIEYYKLNPSAYQNFESVIEVIQRDDSSLLRRDLRKEMYARDLGMVYKLTRTLRFSSSGADFGQGVIVGGIIKEQRLINHGRQ